MEVILMEIWLIWLLVGIIFLIVEIFTPGFFIACLGLAAMVVSVFLLFIPGMMFIWQIVIFLIISIIIFITIRPFALKHLYKRSDQQNTNADGLIGKKGKIISKVDSANPGYMKIYGDEFMAISESGETLEVGDDVEIVRIEGNKVIVKKA
jgi:membrane protein implicated in regulation of membrane protease activity